MLVRFQKIQFQNIIPNNAPRFHLSTVDLRDFIQLSTRINASFDARIQAANEYFSSINNVSGDVNMQDQAQSNHHSQ
jgi:hypothetical protein